MPYCNFKNMKIALSELTPRALVANILHKLGYEFAGDAEVYNSAYAFFTYDSGIIMKTDDMEYFKSHPNEEYVLVGYELKKASEWFKQPATPSFVSPATPFKQPIMKVNIPERFENPVTDGDKAVRAAFDGVIAQLQAPPVGLKPKKLHDQERLIEIFNAMYRYVSTDNVIPAEWFAEAQYLNSQVGGN